jgi:hypothetical protein
MSVDVASGRSPRGQGAPLFVRASSGLVRELTLRRHRVVWDFATGGLFAYVFLFPGPQYASPGISIPLMLVFTLLLGSRLLRVRGARHHITGIADRHRRGICERGARLLRHPGVQQVQGVDTSLAYRVVPPE